MKACPVCSGPVVDVSAILGGRPRVYCGDPCKRAAEKRVQMMGRHVKWAQRVMAMSPSMLAVMRQTYGTQFDKKIEAAKLILEARQNLTGSTTT